MKNLFLLFFAVFQVADAQRVNTGFEFPDIEKGNLKFAEATPLGFGAEPTPREFYIDKKKLPPALLQDGNSCVAQSIIYGYLTFLKQKPMSGDFIYRWCAIRKGFCNESTEVRRESGSPYLVPDEVFSVLADKGTCLEPLGRDWRKPHTPAVIDNAKSNRVMFTCQTFLRDQDLAYRIKRSLVSKKRPVPFGMWVSEEFCDQSFKGNGLNLPYCIYSKPGSNFAKHMVLITGWRDDVGFEVFNSFGRNFGTQGYIYLSKEVFEKNSIVAYVPETEIEFGAVPLSGLTKLSFDSGQSEAYCKLGWKKDRTGQFLENLFDVKPEDITAGNLKAGQILTATSDVNVRSSMPIRRETPQFKGLFLPSIVSSLAKGDKVELLEFRAFLINPPDIKGTATHYWMKVKKIHR